MVKVFGVISLVAGLAVGGVYWSQQARTVEREGSTAMLSAATTALELNHRIRGTYSGVTFSEVKVVRADASSYCVQAGEHFVAGPGGKPQRGHC